MRGLLRGQRTKAWTWKTKRSERWLDSVLPRVSTHSRLLKTQSCYKATVHPPYFPRSRSGLETKDRRKGIKRSGTFATDMVMNKTCHSCLFAAILNFKQSDSPPCLVPRRLSFRGTKTRALYQPHVRTLPQLRKSLGVTPTARRRAGATGATRNNFCGSFSLFFFNFAGRRIFYFAETNFCDCKRLVCLAEH